MFKSNVHQFTDVLRHESKVSTAVLRRLPTYFQRADHKFQLDSSYEPDRGSESANLINVPLIPVHVQIYREMQICIRHGLLRGCLEKSKIQNFRGLAPFVMAFERAKIGNLGLTTQNIVQNFEFLSFWRGKLHLD